MTIQELQIAKENKTKCVIRRHTPNEYPSFGTQHDHYSLSETMQPPLNIPFIIDTIKTSASKIDEYLLVCISAGGYYWAYSSVVETASCKYCGYTNLSGTTCTNCGSEQS